MSVPQWKLWQVIDPRTALAMTTVWLGALGVLLHVIVLSTERFNWFDNGTGLTPMAQQHGVTAPGALTPAPVMVGGK